MSAMLQTRFQSKVHHRARPWYFDREAETLPRERLERLQLKRLRKLLDDRNLTLEVTDRAKKRLAEEGFDPAFGARPLKRAIQREIQNPLALAVLEGRFNDGDRIVADVDGDAIVFRKAEGTGNGVTGLEEGDLAGATKASRA